MIAKFYWNFMVFPIRLERFYNFIVFHMGSKKVFGSCSTCQWPEFGWNLTWLELPTSSPSFFAHFQFLSPLQHLWPKPKPNRLEQQCNPILEPTSQVFHLPTLKKKEFKIRWHFLKTVTWEIIVDLTNKFLLASANIIKCFVISVRNHKNSSLLETLWWC